MVVPNPPRLTRVVALVALGKYFRNRSLPSASRITSRGNSESSDVSRLMTEESIERKLPAGLGWLNNSEKNRGLVLLRESQQGMRKATGLLPGIPFSRSMQQ